MSIKVKFPSVKIFRFIFLTAYICTELTNKTKQKTNDSDRVTRTLTQKLSHDIRDDQPYVLAIKRHFCKGKEKKNLK